MESVVDGGVTMEMDVDVGFGRREMEGMQS
jgi:hypothetical protein